MNGEPRNPTSGIQPQQPKTAGNGLRLGDILALPTNQRRIANWMLRKKECTLPEAADYLGEDEESVQNELDALVQQGFLQEVQAAGSSRYYLKLAAKRGSQVAELLYQVQTSGKPLATIISPSGEITVSPGSTFEQSVTVTNQGNESALIDIFIDEVSDIPPQWFVSSHERLALGRGQTSEVFFQFRIPVDALPESYNYTIVVDAREHYPEDTPLLYPGRFQVVPLVQEARTFNDPTFILQPATSSSAPAPLQVGEILAAIALVYNRSDRVDQFRLTCPDLAAEWFSVIYPEGLPQVGLVVAADALELNPSAQGQIQLLLKPPPGTWAGIYSPTVRLYSANNPDLVLLDVIYLQILPVYLLNVEMLTLVGKVKNQAGLFELRLHNLGNSVREVILRARSLDEEGLCTYTLTPAQVKLLPGESAIVSLEVQPTKTWRRPFYGRLFNFVVELEDPQQLPIPNSQFQGVLMWEPRPWWHFWLLVITILGLIGVIVFLIWWFFPRSPAAPQIIEFAPQGSSYQEANSDVVRLNWKISNPKRLQILRLQGLSPDGLVTSEPIIYDFSQGIPIQLKNFCVIQAVLVCQNVPTDAHKAGDYIFELGLIPTKGKGVITQSLKTNTVRIEPIPQPKIVEFASSKPVYEEAITEAYTLNGSASVQGVETTQPASTLNENLRNASNKSEGILLNWKINNPAQIKELRLIGRSVDGSVNSPLKSYDFSQDIPKSLEKTCKKTEQELICQNVSTEASKAGTYIFELSVIPKQGQKEPLEAKKTDPIKINAKPIPTNIAEFRINGKEALPKYLVEINPAKPIILAISWKVTGGKDIKVELLPAPGKVASEGVIPYPISEKPGSETITLQVSDQAGKQLNRAVTIETFVKPKPELTPTPPSLIIPIRPSPSIPSLPSLKGGTRTVPVLESPSPAGAASPSPAGAVSPSPAGAASPSPAGAASPLPPPTGSSPPLPPNRNSPPPAELPPKPN